MIFTGENLADLIDILVVILYRGPFCKAVGLVNRLVDSKAK